MDKIFTLQDFCNWHKIKSEGVVVGGVLQTTILEAIANVRQLLAASFPNWG